MTQALQTLGEHIAKALPGDVQATYADVADLSARVDFRPDTPIETGIARFVAWYREFYRI